MVVILAGYKHNIAELMSINPGLVSRFSNTFDFPDLSPALLQKVFETYVEKELKLVLSPEAKGDLAGHARRLALTANFSNGRTVATWAKKTLVEYAWRMDGAADGDGESSEDEGAGEAAATEPGAESVLDGETGSAPAALSAEEEERRLVSRADVKNALEEVIASLESVRSGPRGYAAAAAHAAAPAPPPAGGSGAAAAQPSRLKLQQPAAAASDAAQANAAQPARQAAAGAAAAVGMSAAAGAGAAVASSSQGAGTAKGAAAHQAASGSSRAEATATTDTTHGPADSEAEAKKSEAEADPKAAHRLLDRLYALDSAAVDTAESVKRIVEAGAAGQFPPHLLGDDGDEDEKAELRKDFVRLRDLLLAQVRDSRLLLAWDGAVRACWEGPAVEISFPGGLHRILRSAPHTDSSVLL